MLGLQEDYMARDRVLPVNRAKMWLVCETKTPGDRRCLGPVEERDVQLDMMFNRYVRE